jgi:DNA polymerase III alpha subunit
MKTKNAIKDAMWSLYGKKGNDPEILAICETVPDSPQGVDEYDFLYGYTDQEGNYNHGIVELNKTLAKFFEIHPDIQEMVNKLIGTVRGWGRHASAFVISTLDLSADRIPTMMLEDEKLGMIQVTQYDAGMVEKSGLVKADILGLSTLTAVSDCVELMKAKGINYLEEENGVPLIYRLPEDPDVYTDFYNKDTDSSFQFNTELIKGMVQEFCPLNRQALADFTALARPGALDAPLGDSTAAQFYMDVRNGVKDLTFLHDDLEPILRETNGVFVYQESVMKFLVEVAGYTWEESDVIRSAIAKKKSDVIMNTFEKIRTSCRARGWDDDAIETVCQQILAFSRYSFNRSHSFAYGELGYITMYLKHHHPLEWWASMLNLDLKEDKLRHYVSKLGDIVRPPSLKHPSSRFEVRRDENDKGYIVAPVSVIKGIGPKVVQELCGKGPFASLQDFVDRIDHAKCNTGGISALIKGRAADDMMDMSVPYYPDRRKKFIDDFKKLRKKPIKLQEDVFKFDPLSIFLMEKETNKVFNRTLLSNKDIMALIKGFHTDEASMELTSLAETGRDSVPFMMGTTPIIANIKVAEGFCGKTDKDVGMILLYEESSYSSGTSKKSGRPWSKVAVHLSDGYASIECVDWKMKKALGWNKNSIVYVRGQLKPGWKTPVCLDIHEIQRLSKD